MSIRIAHLVHPTFGSVFSGHTHYLFSLLSGWKNEEISLDLLGTQIKPLNINSGERNYRLPLNSLWSNQSWPTRKDRIRWSWNVLSLLVSHRNEYDIVHFHALNWGILLSPLILHSLGKKVIYTMSLFGNDNPSFLINQPRGRLHVALLRLFDGVIGISPALTEDARKYSLHNVICLPNFMAVPQLEKTPTPDSRAAARSNLHIPPDKQVLLFVGSMINRKGVDIVVDVFLSLAEKYPDLWLVMVGAQNKTELTYIDDTYVSQQKTKITRAGHDNRCIWVGLSKEQTTLVNYYNAADIFLFPTRNEGLPNVLIEASYAELPLVASHLSGSTDTVVRNGENGYLISVDDTEGFTNSINVLLSNPNLRASMGKKGRQRACELFGFDQYCKRLKEFYIEIAGN